MRHLQGVTIVVFISVYVLGQIVSRCIIPKLITSTNGFFQCLEEVSSVLLLVFFQICLALTTLPCFSGFHTGGGGGGGAWNIPNSS